VTQFAGLRSVAISSNGFEDECGAFPSTMVDRYRVRETTDPRPAEFPPRLGMNRNGFGRCDRSHSRNWIGEYRFPAGRCRIFAAAGRANGFGM